MNFSTFNKSNIFLLLNVTKCLFYITKVYYTLQKIIFNVYIIIYKNKVIIASRWVKKKQRSKKKTVVILFLLCEKIFPDIENMRSTAADEALTEKYYLTKPA